MSREPKRMEENMRGSSKLIVYITVAAIIAIVIISYAIIGSIISNNREEQRLAELEAEDKLISEQEALTIELGKAQENENSEDAEIVSTQIGKTVEESSKQNGTNEENVASSTNTQSENKITENNNTTNSNEVNKTSSNEAVNTNVEKEETKKEITFTMPVEGEIVRGFAKDSLVYSETLQEWIVHQAIDIKANSRDVVKAAAEGTVVAIKNDPRYGLTVIIEHDGGFKTIYSNLLTAEFVVQGEKVKQGQTLGTIGSSATFEIADEPHLHFEMLKNSEYIDPSIYIK